MSTWAQIASKIEPDVLNKESKIKSKEIKFCRAERGHDVSQKKSGLKTSRDLC